MDMINKLPLSTIETILCCLPIQEAARTSILSKEWRYHWVKIPKIMVIEDTFQVSTDAIVQKLNKKTKFLNAICQVVLTHEGPIREFTLSMDDLCVEIGPIIFQLSKRNTVKKLTLYVNWGYRLLPLSLFSMSELTDLHLTGCNLCHIPIFSGLGNLTSLHVHESWISTKTLLHLLSSCPLLRTVSLKVIYGSIDDRSGATVSDLFECLPVIENLTIWYWVIEDLARDRIPQEVPFAFLHLKYLCIEEIVFSQGDGLRIISLLIRSSPNLEKLEVEIKKDWRGEYESFSFTLEDYSDIWLEHLRELEITYLSNSKIELNFVKRILSKSPVLKKLRIFISGDYKDKELQISEIILCSPCASPAVEFIFA